MKFIKSAIFAILLVVVPFAAFGQETFTGITYQVSVPFSDTKDFTKDVSFRGFGLEFRKTVRPQTAIGLSLNWNVFHTVTDEMINLTQLGEEGNAALDISGTQNRIINSFPLLVTAHRYLGNDDTKVPFVGLGAGATYRESRLEIGVVSIEDKKWHFTLAPEVGFAFQAGYDVYVGLSVKYNYMFSSGGSTQSYLGLNVGIFYF